MTTKGNSNNGLYVSGTMKHFFNVINRFYEPGYLTEMTYNEKLL